MSKFTERMLFFVFTPMTFIFWGIQWLTYDCSSAETAGCEVGVSSAFALMVSLPIGLGLIFRHRRIKQEKTNQQTE